MQNVNLRKIRKRIDRYFAELSVPAFCFCLFVTACMSISITSAVSIFITQLSGWIYVAVLVPIEIIMFLVFWNMKDTEILKMRYEHKLAVKYHAKPLDIFIDGDCYVILKKDGVIKRNMYTGEDMPL